MSDRRNILLSVALFLAAVALTWPILEMGFIDDWSYTHIAREFAARGHFAYNGWAFAMLIPQVLWSAAFVKLFGFSFLAVRLSTVVLAIFLVPVLYYLGRESGLAPRFALFATLLTMLSPLVIPLADSFLSDFPAFLFFALCYYGGIKTWKATTTKACAGWVGLIVLAGIAAALDRQVYWLAPLLFLPVVAWVQRRRKGAVMCMGVGWLLAIAVAGYSTLWYQAKPYSLHEHTLDVWKRLPLRFMATWELLVLIDLGLTAGLILLPLLVGYISPGFRAVSRRVAVLALAGVLAGGLFFSIRPVHAVPALGNVLTEYGILGAGVATLGVRPMVLRPLIRKLLTTLVFLSCAGCGLALWKRRGTDRARIWQDPATPALTLGGAFTAVWLPAMIFRSSGSPAFDRYLITLLPLVAIPLLRYYQVHIGGGVSRWSWATLALFAVYGVATTHDAFAMGRARVTAAQALERSGVPRTEITAGFEYDGWTQLETAGYINNPQIESPAGSFRVPTCPGLRVLRLWFAWDMPAIHPRYYVVLSRLKELEDIPTAHPVGYTTWLPPGQRQVFTQVLPGGESGGCR